VAPPLEPGTYLTDPPFYNPAFEEACRYIIDEYEIPSRDLAIFIPCAVKKPYSASPSHRLFRKVINSVLEPEQYHIVIFGTCGVVPAELELMYPFAHYQYMLGKVTDETIKADFLEIETKRVAGYLEKTRHTYRYRLAYCIGIFREAMVRGSARAGVEIDILLPTRPMIEKLYDPDCPFPEGSLSMQEYIEELRGGLREMRERINQSEEKIR
jgi:archaeosine synthase